MPSRKSPVRLDWIDPAACTLDYRLKLIARLPFFKELPPPAIREINKLFHDHGYTAGQPVYFEGDAAQYLYLVAMGRVRLVRNTTSGHEVSLDMLHGGEHFGNLTALGAKTYTETAIAHTDCCILQIASDDFETLLKRYPDVTLKVLSAVGQRLQQSQEVVKQLSSYTVEQRVASVLCRLVSKMGEESQEGVLIQLPFSRQDLAAMAGTTTETVSRIMRRLADAGLVETGRKWVAVKDRAALETLLKEDAVN